MRFWGLTGHRAQVGAGGAVSGHSQPHPRPALDPLPIKPDLSGARWRVRWLSKLLASIWAHSTWGLEWDVGCGTSRPEGRAWVWGIPHLRACGRLYPVLKGHSPGLTSLLPLQTWGR